MDEKSGDGEERRLRLLEDMAEKAYSDMYDASSSSGAAALYSDAKESLYDAIGLARRLGRDGDAEKLEKRLAHIKAVFRGQFSG